MSDFYLHFTLGLPHLEGVKFSVSMGKILL